VPNVMAIFRQGSPPNAGIECRWDRQKSRRCVRKVLCTHLRQTVASWWYTHRW